MDDNKKPIALITGASSGIGWDIALELAKQGYQLVLIARRTAKLAELADLAQEQYQTKSYIFPCDLTAANAHQEIVNFIEHEQLNIDVLVNNAGFGDNLLFADSELTRVHDMLQVNIRSLVDLTYYFLPQMIMRGSGRILNVASTAALQPVPYMAIYAATKAFVLSFSEALYEENRDKNISVTALCPGPTHTEFAQAAHMQQSRLFSLPLLGALSSSYVAEKAVNAMLAGKRRVLPGLRNKLMMWISNIVPKNISLRTTKSFTQNRVK